MAASARGEQVAVAGLVVRQAQAAGQALAGAGPAPARPSASWLARQQFVGHAALLQHRDVALHGVELRLGAEQLQRAAACAASYAMPVSARSSRRQSRLYSATRIMRSLLTA